MNGHWSFWRSPTGFGIVATVLFAVFAARQGFIEISLHRLEGSELGVLFLTLIFTALVIERAVEVYINNRYDPQEMALQRGIREAQQKLTLLDEALQREIARQVPPAGDAAASAAAEERAGAIARLREEAAAAREEVRSAKAAALGDQISLESRKATEAGALATVLGALAAGTGVRILGQFLETDAETGALAGPLGQTCDRFAQQLQQMTAGPERDALLASCEAVELQLGVFRFTDVLLTALLLAGGADGIHQLVKDFLSKRNDLRPTG